MQVAGVIGAPICNQPFKLMIRRYLITVEQTFTVTNLSVTVVPT